MTSLFTARFSYAQDDGTVHMAGLADHRYETKCYILLQQTIRPSEQDCYLGLDKVHITVNDQNHATHGGLEQVVLNRDSLIIRVTPTAAHELGTQQDIMIALAPDLPGLDRFADSLRVMLASLFRDQR